MSRFWWQLPGPAEYIRKVAGELREGRNVILALPRHLPDGLGEAIRAERFAEGGATDWSRLWLSNPQARSPARQIADQVLPQPCPGAVDASVLAHHDGFAGQVVWLDNLTTEAWPRWRDFLAEYAHDCRSRPFLERSLFVVPLAGPAVSRLPPEDVALAIHRWSGVVEPLDQMLFVSRLLRPDPRRRLLGEVTGAVIARLALWDPTVSELLAGLPLERILDPLPVLTRLAQQRGWSTLPEDPQQRWQEGMADQFGGREHLHSCLLGLGTQPAALRELNRRVWSAQVGVLLPFVENLRREILERFAGQLTGPFRFQNGVVVDDPINLEIGQIEYQLIQSRGKAPRMISLLKEIRNRLAHLEIVDAATILSPDLHRAP